MNRLVAADHISKLQEAAVEGGRETIRKRAQILLYYTEGYDTNEIAEKMAIPPRRVLYWRRAYLKDGLSILEATDDLDS